MKLKLFLILIFMVLVSCDKLPFKKNNYHTYLIPPKYILNDSIYLGLSFDKSIVKSDHKYEKNEFSHFYEILDKEKNKNNRNVFFNYFVINHVSDYVSQVLLKNIIKNNDTNSKFEYIKQSVSLIKDLINEYNSIIYFNNENIHFSIDSSLRHKDIIKLGFINSDSTAYFELCIYDLNKMTNTKLFDNDKVLQYFMNIVLITNDTNALGTTMKQVSTAIKISDNKSKNIFLDSLDIWEKRFKNSN